MADTDYAGQGIETEDERKKRLSGQGLLGNLGQNIGGLGTNFVNNLSNMPQTVSNNIQNMGQ